MSFPYSFPVTEDEAATILDFIPDHAGAARDRLAQEYKFQPNLGGLLDAFNTETQVLEEAFWALLNQRGLTSAFGVQLDILGEILGQPRMGLTDDDYRLWLISRIRLNLGSCTVEDVYSIFILIVPPGTTLTIRDEFPAAFTLVLDGAPVVITQLIRLLRLAKAAGVRVILEWFEADPATVFQFDGTDAQAFDTGFFAGATV